MEESDAVLAVVAHGLLNAAYPVLAAGQALQRPELPDGFREELVGIIVERTAVVVEMLHDLMRGVSPDVRDALDSINSRGG